MNGMDRLLIDRVESLEKLWAKLDGLVREAGADWIVERQDVSRAVEALAFAVRASVTTTSPEIVTDKPADVSDAGEVEPARMYYQRRCNGLWGCYTVEEGKIKLHASYNSAAAAKRRCEVENCGK